ncbi:hypothetical protein ACA910_012685 [Epithemia clementina (nom. ined.)]
MNDRQVVDDESFYDATAGGESCASVVAGTSSSPLAATRLPQSVTVSAPLNHFPAPPKWNPNSSLLSSLTLYNNLNNNSSSMDDHDQEDDENDTNDPHHHHVAVVVNPDKDDENDDDENEANEFSYTTTGSSTSSPAGPHFSPQAPPPAGAPPPPPSPDDHGGDADDDTTEHSYYYYYQYSSSYEGGGPPEQHDDDRVVVMSHSLEEKNNPETSLPRNNHHINNHKATQEEGQDLPSRRRLQNFYNDDDMALAQQQQQGFSSPLFPDEDDDGRNASLSISANAPFPQPPQYSPYQPVQQLQQQQQQQQVWHSYQSPPLQPQPPEYSNQKFPNNNKNNNSAFLQQNNPTIAQQPLHPQQQQQHYHPLADEEGGGGFPPAQVTQQEHKKRKQRKQQRDQLTNLRDQSSLSSRRQYSRESSSQLDTVDLGSTDAGEETIVFHKSGPSSVVTERHANPSLHQGSSSSASSSSSPSRGRPAQQQQRNSRDSINNNNNDTNGISNSYQFAYQQNGDLGSRAFVVHYEEEDSKNTASTTRALRHWVTASGGGDATVAPNVGLSNSYEDSLCGMAPHELLRLLQVANALASISSVVVASLSWLGKILFLQLDKAVLLAYLAMLSLVLLIVEIVATATPEQQRLVPNNIMGRIRDQMGFLFHPFGKALFVLLLTTMCWGIGGLFLTLIGTLYFTASIGWFYAAFVYRTEASRLMGSIDETYRAEARRRGHPAVRDATRFSISSWNAFMRQQHPLAASSGAAAAAAAARTWVGSLASPSPSMEQYDDGDEDGDDDLPAGERTSLL